MGKTLFLHKIDSSSKESQIQDTDRDTRYDDYQQVLLQNTHQKVLNAFVLIFQMTLKVGKMYADEHRHQINFTPVQFTHAFTTYSKLLEEREANVEKIRKRYTEGAHTLRNSIDALNAYVKKLTDHSPGLIAQ